MRAECGLETLSQAEQDGPHSKENKRSALYLSITR